jgi:hypothetical protein
LKNILSERQAKADDIQYDGGKEKRSFKDKSKVETPFVRIKISTIPIPLLLKLTGRADSGGGGYPVLRWTEHLPDESRMHITGWVRETFDRHKKQVKKDFDCKWNCCHIFI